MSKTSLRLASSRTRIAIHEYIPSPVGNASQRSAQSIGTTLARVVQEASQRQIPLRTRQCGTESTNEALPPLHCEGLSATSEAGR